MVRPGPVQGELRSAPRSLPDVDSCVLILVSRRCVIAEKSGAAAFFSRNVILARWSTEFEARRRATGARGHHVSAASRGAGGRSIPGGEGAATSPQVGGAQAGADGIHCTHAHRSESFGMPCYRLFQITATCLTNSHQMVTVCQIKFTR